MKIQILCDNPSSWVVPFAKEMMMELAARGYVVTLLHSTKEVTTGDILILLSCERIFKQLKLNKHNLVVHASALPEGKGWSPMTWQILEGKNRIPVTLFEAVEELDAGPIYGQVYLELKGSELIDELRLLQIKATRELIHDFLQQYPNVKGESQKGVESFYPRRTAEHSRLDANRSIREQFDLLRVCDNERYPVYFELNGETFILKVYKKV